MSDHDLFVCWHCPALFVPNRHQRQHAAALQPVFCSQACSTAWHTRYGVGIAYSQRQKTMVAGQRYTRLPHPWKGAGKPLIPWWKPAKTSVSISERKGGIA